MLQDSSTVQKWSSLKVRRHVNHSLPEFQEVVVVLMLHPNKPKKDNIESDTPCARRADQNRAGSTQCHLDFFHRVWTMFPCIKLSRLPNKWLAPCPHTQSYFFEYMVSHLCWCTYHFRLTKRSDQVHSMNAKIIGSSPGSTAIQCTHCTLDKEIPTSRNLRT